MSNYEIKPLLANSKKMNEFYDYLLDVGYKIKIWDKKADKDIYDFFLPAIREYILWTFNFGKDTKFVHMSNEMQAAVCNNYSSTTFEYENSLVVCFHTGVVFSIKKYQDDGSEKSKSKKLQQDKVLSYRDFGSLEEININQTQRYKIETEKQTELFNYIISLYKFVMLSKLNKDMENEDYFDKNRKIFVKFVQEIFSQKVTDNLQGVKQSAEWEQKLGVDKLYLAVENKFDLLYRNSRLDDHNSTFRIIIMLLVVLIIIGIINLANWLW